MLNIVAIIHSLHFITVKCALNAMTFLYYISICICTTLKSYPFIIRVLTSNLVNWKSKTAHVVIIEYENSDDIPKGT